MFRFSHIIMLCAVFALAGCEKVIDFDPGEVEPYVVMVSRPESDSLVNVYLTQSRFFLDNSFAYYDRDRDNRQTYITDATVTLWVAGNSYSGVLQQKGNKQYYQFGVRPQPGDSLYIEATVPGHDGKVSSGTRIPTLPDFELVELSELPDDGGYKLRFKLKSGQAREYYSVSLQTWGEVSYYDSVTGSYITEIDSTGENSHHYYFNVNDPIVNNMDVTTAFDGDDGSFHGSEMLFSNELFSNGELEFTMEFDQGYRPYLETYVEDLPIYLVVTKLTPELYKYKMTLRAQDNSDDLFGEPVQVFSNISGGIGIFAGSSQKRLRMTINR